ncbi:hypothetical protein SLA2020_170350 [Shorea laevis]
MVEIFRKNVEKPEIERGRFKLSSSDFQELGADKFKVRDNQGKEWNCYCKKGSGDEYNLHVEKWKDFVEKLGIKAGRSEISLHKEAGHFGAGGPSYKFEVENR